MMQNSALEKEIVRLVLEELKRRGVRPVLKDKAFVPVGVTARHVHLKREHFVTLFGTGFELTEFKPISQPGQYAAHQMVSLKGPKGQMDNVRILGPLRSQTQIEASLGDLRRLGIEAPVRESGKLKGSAGVTLIGPKGTIVIDEGLILMERHIHMTPEDAAYYGVHNGQKVRISTGGIKGGILDNVFIRVREDFALDTHIDTDDANALGLSNGDFVQIIK